MGLFNKNMFIGGFVLDGIVKKGPSLLDKVDMLVTDVETEGKKKGYARAAAEYEKAFREIESQYKKAKEMLEAQKNSYDKQTDDLIDELEDLERQKQILEKRVKLKTKAVSEKYNVPVSEVQRSLSGGSLIAGPMSTDILGLIYSHKEKKLREAENRGYIEARELYDEKLRKMKRELNEKIKKGDAEIRELANTMRDVLDAIADEQMKIAELKILT